MTVTNKSVEACLDYLLSTEQDSFEEFCFDEDIVLMKEEEIKMKDLNHIYVSAMLAFYGEREGTKLVKDLIKELKNE